MAHDIEQENRDKQKVARLSIISNAVLTTSKIITGICTGSVSIISEGVHSGIDLFASLVAFFSVKKSSLPPDRDHAFGHGKYEDASGMLEAILILAAAGVIIWEAVSKLISGESEISYDVLYIGLIVMGVSALMNFIVSQCLMKVAKRTHSIALESDAWHLRTDVLTSAGVFLGIVVIQITQISFLDSIIAIAVALIIVRSAWHLIRKSFSDLMDESLDDKELDIIEGIIERHRNDYTNYHGLKTRRAGPDCFAEFHLMMPAKLPLDEAHHLAKHIEDEMTAEIPHLSVIIHIDPCDRRCGRDVCTFVCRKIVKKE